MFCFASDLLRNFILRKSTGSFLPAFFGFSISLARCGLGQGGQGLGSSQGGCGDCRQVLVGNGKKSQGGL